MRNRLILFRLALKGLRLTKKKTLIYHKAMKEEEIVGGKTYVAKQRSRKSIQFDMDDEAAVKRFAKVIDGLQVQKTDFVLQQDGDTVWIDFA